MIGQKNTPGKLNMEPQSHAFEKENHASKSIMFRYYGKLLECETIFLQNGDFMEILTFYKVKTNSFEVFASEKSIIYLYIDKIYQNNTHLNKTKTP